MSRTAKGRRIIRIHRKLARAFAVALAAFFIAALAGAAEPRAAEPPTVRVGVLKFGTVNWELDVLRHHGLDRRHGVKAEVLELTGKDATAVALQGGAVDVIVTDWIWVSYRRSKGADFTFVTHSHTVGGLMVRPDANIATLADLKGKRVGVAGGPVDKSWLLLRAYGRRTLGVDLATAAEPVFGAPPLLNQMMQRGDLPAVLNFWHYNARLAAGGMRELIAVADMLPALGIAQTPPLLGWVFGEAWAARNAAAIDGFLKASRDAKKLLATSDGEWERIRPLTQAEDDATFRALRAAYRQGVALEPRGDAAAAAGAVLKILAEFGDADTVGSAAGLEPGTFWRGAGN
jgi:NitT/TauT family transport system substrate-binding protein